MSQWYNADFEDLDWVQAPPKANNNDRSSCRKDSYNNSGAQGAFVKKSHNRVEEHPQSKASHAARPVHQKKTTTSDYCRQQSDNNKARQGHYDYAVKKPARAAQQTHQKPFKPSRYDDRSTDVSDENSPDRFTKNSSCNDMKVEVFGEVVIDQTNPKFKQQRLRKSKFAGACELKAPEPHEIAMPSFL